MTEAVTFDEQLASESLLSPDGAKDPPRWDTELLVLHGRDRAELRRRLKTLQEYLHQNADVSLLNLAFTNHSELQDGGSRLALVAGNVHELRSRLDIAAERLDDPKRTQIKDSAGIYYFEQPLHPQGGLALLFPGEGAQYLNMLSDLVPHFPEVKKCFEDCDRMAARGQAAERRHFSRVFLVPEDAGPKEKAAAEKALRELDNAMFSVFMADWAMYQLLLALGLRPNAMAGHSMGELAALWAAGCLDGTTFRLDQVAATMKNLLEQEEAGQVADAVLLAVGAGKDGVEKIIADRAGADAFLAMDNCPHQTVVVGRPGPMAAVEVELQARRILCERLPFHRPYHTPLFESYLGPLQELFETIPFRPAQTPIYSCSTGRLFPADEAEIRRLAVWHYAMPVEFRRLIENMYTDGVRLFVEAGPRGNLTAFVEDVLRGRPFAAVASNLPRRSGLSQLHHLAGLLAAHHVPLNLDLFYRGRDPMPVRWNDGQAVRSEGRGTNGDLPAPVAPGPSPLGFRPCSLVLAQYLETMEQFLDTEREVMEAYLSRRGRNELPGANYDGRPDGHDSHSRPLTPNVSLTSGPSALDPRSLPLLGSIVRHDPGREIVMQRRLDLAEDLFATHHTVGGRAASKVDPDQHGLPVMPMTFSLEIAAEVAALLLPGMVVIGIKDIRLFRWLAFDEEEPTTIEVIGRVVKDEMAGGTGKSANEPQVSAPVAVEIRDLGNATSPGPRSPAALCTVLLGADYPEPPLAADFPLTGDHLPTVSLEVLYKNLFHGPLFQGTCTGGRAGEEGIEKEVVVLPRNELLRSNPDPQFLLDPVLLDVAMHPLAAWHLEMFDQTGRILLPIEVDKIEIFGPRPDVGARLLSRGLILETTPRHFLHQVDVLPASSSRFWCRFRRIKYWRFYVPFAKVNFHGPKDEYFISTEWTAPLGGASGATGMMRSEPEAACIRLDIPVDQKQAGLRLVTSRVTLSPEEMPAFRRLHGDERQQTDWLFGRIAAKDAVRVLWHARYKERLFPADIIIKETPEGKLVAVMRGAGHKASGAEQGGQASRLAPLPPLPAVSIAHCEDVCAGLAAFGPYVGIDMERFGTRPPGFEETAFSPHERQLLKGLAAGRDEWAVRLWCAKRALAKATGAALVDGPDYLTVRTISAQTGIVHVAVGPALADACPELQGAIVGVQTSRDGDLVVAVTFCDKVEG